VKAEGVADVHEGERPGGVIGHVPLLDLSLFAAGAAGAAGGIAAEGGDGFFEDGEHEPGFGAAGGERGNTPCPLLRDDLSGLGEL
jgi:hypothetical protein